MIVILIAKNIENREILHQFPDQIPDLLFLSCENFFRVLSLRSPALLCQHLQRRLFTAARYERFKKLRIQQMKLLGTDAGDRVNISVVSHSLFPFLNESDFS